MNAKEGGLRHRTTSVSGGGCRIHPRNERGIGGGPHLCGRHGMIPVHHEDACAHEESDFVGLSQEDTWSRLHTRAILILNI